METIIESLQLHLNYLLPILITLFLTSILLYHFNHSPNNNKNTPPGSKGIPFLGESFAYGISLKRGTPEKFINDRKTKYSPDVFRTSLFGENMAVFCGADGNKCLFTGHNKYVKSWWPKSVDKILSGGAPTKENYSDMSSTSFRGFFSAFLKADALQHYIPIMDAMAKDHLEKDWSPNIEVKVFNLTKKYTFALACKLFVSIDDPVYVRKLGQSFDLLTEGIFSLHIDLPGTVYNKTVKGGKIIRKEISCIIAKRKQEMEENKESFPKDMLSSMLLDEMNDNDIVNIIIGFFIASNDTTSTALTFIVNYLAEYPYVYDKVYEEQMEVLRSKNDGEDLNWKDVQKMKYTWCVANEAMRLAPPASGSFREVITDFTFAGYTIPKGWKTFWNVYTTNKDSTYFPDPEKFDPSRFERNEIVQYSFAPFGGGPRMCPGKEFARLTILTYIHNVVTKFKWEKLIPDEKIIYKPSPVPENGLPVSLKLIENK